MAALLAALAIGSRLGLGVWEYPLRCAILLAALLIFSRPELNLRIRSTGGSVALGVAVFAVWIAPDVLIPGWRAHWLFQNSILGTVESSVAPEHRASAIVVVFRAIRGALLVPVIEELFWRAWLMRWLIQPDFRSVPLGAYVPQAFWITAGLFALEHGPYWDVGLLAGIAYGWWMVRTRSLGDCALAHAVTNGCLAAYVLWSGQWQYW
jgi:CAAX prenyl protease-like protein